MSPKKILFVCLGNICRSPSAEAVFRRKALAVGLSIHFDSAGTSANHVGESSDRRSIHHAAARGYEMTHLARQICKKDFEYFDLILVMDENNERHVRQMAESHMQKKIDLLTRHCHLDGFSQVPDPYYGGADEFELVLDIIEDAWNGFIKIYFPSVIP